MVGVSVLLRVVNALGVVGDVVHERVVSIFLARSVVGSKVGIIRAYAGMPPGIVVNDGMQMCLPEGAVVSSGFGDPFVDSVLGTLPNFLVMGAVPEDMVDCVSLLAMGTLVRVDDLGRFESISGTDRASNDGSERIVFLRVGFLEFGGKHTKGSRDVNEEWKVTHVFAIRIVALTSLVEGFKEIPSNPIGDVLLEEAGLDVDDVCFAIVLVDQVDGSSFIEDDFEFESVSNIIEDMRGTIDVGGVVLVGSGIVAASDELRKPRFGAHDGASGSGEDVVDDGRPGVGLCWVV